LSIQASEDPRKDPRWAQQDFRVFIKQGEKRMYLTLLDESAAVEKPL
jgi:hypothetical protein